MGTKVLDTKIRTSMGIRKAQSERHGLFIGNTAKCTGAEDFKELAKMIVKGEEK